MALPQISSKAGGYSTARLQRRGESERKRKGGPHSLTHETPIGHISMMGRRLSFKFEEYVTYYIGLCI